MHVALMANTAWLDEELAMFRYLVVGLIDEQVRVAQVLPEILPDSEASVFGARVPWRDSSVAAIRRWRIGRMSEALSPLDVTLLHALDGRLWSGAVKLAKKMDLSVVLNVNSVLDLGQIVPAIKQWDPQRIAFAASTEPLAQAVRERLGDRNDVLVETIKPGVHVLEDVVPSDHSEQTFCGVIASSGRYDADMDTLFAGVRHLVDQYPEVQFFLDVQGRDPHRFWRAAATYELHANMSMVPRRLGHRELMLRADVLIHPQAVGKTRGLLQQAMAQGVPVLARADVWQDALIDQQTAWLVQNEPPKPEDWIERLERVIERRDAVQRLVDSARQYVRDHHLASHQVERTLHLYRQLTGEPIKLFG